MSEKSIFIPARLKSSVINGHVTGAADIIDDALNKTQDVINQEDKEDIARLREDVDTINSKIPEEASPDNQLADKAFVTNLVNEEKERAEEAEASLDDKITAETQRATDAEENLDAKIDAEIGRATRVEATLDSKIDQEIADRTADVDAEETRARASETALDNKIDQEIADRIEDVNTEESRAKAVEQAISDDLSQEITRAIAAEQENATDILNEISRATTAEQAISTALAQETSRAQGAEQTLQSNLNDENARAIQAEETLQANLTAEETRATTAEASLLNALTAEESRAMSAENTIAGNLSSEETRAKAAERQNSDDIATINSKIPSQASDVNQLADKDFVNSTVSTATAEFKGTYNSLQELEAVTADNNDYGFVVSVDSAGNTVYNKYKYNGSEWLFEYALNNSSFTAAQWATINSLLTSSHKDKLDALPTSAELSALFDTKQDVIGDLETIRQGAALGATAYQKPQNGIPSTDMTSEVQTSLSKADTAYQKSSAGIPSSDLSQNVQDSLGLADSAYQLPSNGIPKTDLASDVQASLGKADTALQEHQSLSDYYTKSETDDLLSDKQETLESGTNIKTINNQSILGSGNITIQAGSTLTAGNGIDITNDEVSVKLGSNLSFDSDGVINATDTTYDVFTPAGVDASSGLVPAPRTTPGSSRYLCEDGTWKTPAGGGGGYELPVASATELGGVKIGAGLSIDGNGILSTEEQSFKDLYIGTGATYQDVMIPANLHQVVRKGEPISITSSQSYLFVIIPSAYSAIAMMEGIVIPTTQTSQEVSGKTYKIYKSNLAYTGSFNLILF